MTRIRRRVLPIAVAATLLLGMAGALAPAASAAPAPPRGDLTGDGTVDSWSTAPDDVSGGCYLTITPADTDGVFAHRSFAVPLPFSEWPPGECLTTVTEGQVRGDGSWQLFVVDQVVGYGANLTTAIRGSDGFAAEQPAVSPENPQAPVPVDTDGDGRDDTVRVAAGYWDGPTLDIAVGPDGHFGASRLAPHQATISVTPSVAVPGDPAVAHVIVDGNGNGTPTGTVELTVTNPDPTEIPAWVGISGPLVPAPDGRTASVDVVIPGISRLTSLLGVRYLGDDRLQPSGTSIHFLPPSIATVLTVTPSSTPVANVPTTVQVRVRPRPAAVADQRPTGFATISVDGTDVGSTEITDGTGWVTVPGLAAGAHVMVASYFAGSDFAWLDSSSTTTLTVRKGATRTTVRSGSPTPAVGQQVSLSIQVTSSTPAVGTPTGTVGLLIDGRPVTARLVAGKATVRTSFRSAGRHLVLVGYPGDQDRAASGGAITITVHR